MARHIPVNTIAASRCEQVVVRGLRHNVRHWGSADAPAVFLLHGWMDTSASFQFIVDALRRDWHVIAPDWRGHGESEWLGRPYWFPDYYADLDALLAHYSPTAPARLVGHSMGASIAATYAGVRPDRVERLVVMDFLGLPPSVPEDAPDRLRQWLAALRDPPAIRTYPDQGAFARRLMKANPRLGAERAGFLARQITRVMPDGSVTMACDPWHRVPAPVRYQTEDVLAGWRQIKSPVLVLLAEDGFATERFGHGSAEIERRVACFADRQVVTVAECGHNLQHDQPERVAQLIEAFMGEDPRARSD